MMTNRFRPDLAKGTASKAIMNLIKARSFFLTMAFAALSGTTAITAFGGGVVITALGGGAVIAALGSGSAFAGGIATDVIAPHRALYEIELRSVKSGAQLSNLSGRMYFEWKRDCDAWNTDNRSVLYYTYTDGTTTRINSDFITREDLKGKDFNFSAKRSTDGKTIEEYRGYASGEKAVYSIPAGHVVELPRGTMFPMGHTAEIMARMKKGEKYFTVPLFDGSDDKKPPEVSVFIGADTKAPEAILASKKVDTGLIASPAHKMHIAFFPSDSDSDASDYEMDLVAHDNGVVSDIDITYDSFSIRQKLVALQKVDAPDNCGADHATDARPAPANLSPAKPAPAVKGK